MTMGTEALIERLELIASGKTLADQRGYVADGYHPAQVAGEAAAALKAAEAALPDPLAHYHTQREAAGRYGFKRGGLQSAWRALQRTDKSELEWAIVDALGMGGIAAWPGDGVGCAARIVEAQISRAEQAEVDLTAARAEIERLTAGILDIQSAANSFCDESGDEVAGQVRLRCRALLGEQGK
jgi:hypothetical protein